MHELILKLGKASSCSEQKHSFLAGKQTVFQYSDVNVFCAWAIFIQQHRR